MAGEHRILVTGASGFVGSALCPALERAAFVVGRAGRGGPASGLGPAAAVEVGQIDGHTDWIPALRSVGCVVHLAARTHVLRETAIDPLAEYRRVNVEGTRRLAGQAAKIRES
jgi:UDP-glucose 4-epimerase